MKKPTRKKIVIISNPVPATNESGLLSLLKFIDVLFGVYNDKVTLISGNILPDRVKDRNVDLKQLKKRRSRNKIVNIIFNILFQIKAGFTTFFCIRRGDLVFFWIADAMIIPYFFTRIRGAKLFYFIYGNPVKIVSNKRSEIQTAKRIIFFANNADYVCAEDIRVFNEWGEKIKNPNRKTIHLYTEIRSIPRKEEKTIGMICRISEGKYVYESIQAFESLVDIYPDWKMEILGSGPLYNECERYINEKGLHNRIRMYGWVDSEKKWDVMAKWSYLLFPTDTEGLPNSLLECMSLGIVPICSPVSSIPSLVEESISGFYIEDNSSIGINSAIRKALSEMSLLYGISENCKRIINDLFSFDKSIMDARRELSSDLEF